MCWKLIVWYIYRGLFYRPHLSRKITDSVNSWLVWFYIWYHCWADHGNINQIFILLVQRSFQVQPAFSCCNPELFIVLHILTVGFHSFCYSSLSNSTLNFPACIKYFIVYQTVYLLMVTDDGLFWYHPLFVVYLLFFNISWKALEIIVSKLQNNLSLFELFIWPLKSETLLPDISHIPHRLRDFPWHL